MARSRWIYLALAACALASHAAALPAAHAADAIGGAELAAAERLAASWGLRGGLSFLTLADAGKSPADALSSAHSDSLVVALLGDKRPQRRNASAGQPFLRLASPSPAAAELLFLEPLNAAAELLETYTGRHLFPFTLVTEPAGAPTEKAGPWAVWDVSAGALHLSPRLLAALGKPPPAARQAVSRFASGLFRLLGERSLPPASQGWRGALAAAAPLALAAAFAAAVPVWFCIACPIVLGLLAPLLINAGLGGAAELVCEHYQLPQQECDDLWFGAFGLAMALSLASAIPIVAVCRLRECARPR